MASVRLLGSGTILREAVAAAALLADDWHVVADVFSVTSFSELARDARDAARWNRLHPGDTARRSHVAQLLAGDAPIVAASDYVCALPALIAEHVDARYVTLGTDGFGRSDTRKALRRFFEVDRHHIAVAALDALARDGTLPHDVVAEAIARYAIDVDLPNPWDC
jgi:pyruvate dehydrogenase E1 component